MKQAARQSSGIPGFCCVLVLPALLLPSCLINTPTDTIPDGTYAGTFTITHADGKSESGGVTFTFAGGTYRCIPVNHPVPPGGGGAFSTWENTLFLRDEVAHTAEFDWTLILNGGFSISMEGPRLILQQRETRFHRLRVIDLVRQ
jgi:hypothetical protein